MNGQSQDKQCTSLPPEQLLTAIITGTDDAIISKDLTGTIISWNPAATRLFGYAPSEVLGRPITILIPPERQGEETTILRRLQVGERIEHFETVRITRDGRLLDVSLTISPIRDSSGVIIGASKIARDITGQKLVQEALRQAHAQLTLHAQRLESEVADRTADLRESLNELETFSSSISHDIKAPLRAIHTLAEILGLEHGHELSPVAREIVEKIDQRSAQLLRFVDNVLSYARLRQGTVEMHRVELSPLVMKVLDEYPHVRQANAAVQICHPLLCVIASEGLLTQCLANLLGNAVKFVAPGIRPKLKIWTEPQGTDVRLWIQDNAIGIAEGDRARIFGLFTRVHSSSQYDGTGVGLAVVSGAVRKMGGTTGVESELGKGSRFWIELPAA